VAAPAPATAAAWQRRSLAWLGSDASPSVQEVMSVTEQRDWPPEQSAKGTLRPWHYTAAAYLAVLFEDPEEAQRAQRGRVVVAG
jgi:hypothetical protein